jgi:hypothetical protein
MLQATKPFIPRFYFSFKLLSITFNVPETGKTHQKRYGKIILTIFD